MPRFAPRMLAHRRHRPWPTPCLAPRGTSRAARLPVALDTAWLPRVATPRQMLSLPSHKWNSQCATQLAAPLSRFCMPRCTGFVPPLHGSARTHSAMMGGAVCMAMPTTGEHCNIPDNGPLPASGSRFTASTMSESAMVHHDTVSQLRCAAAPRLTRTPFRCLGVHGHCCHERPRLAFQCRPQHLLAKPFCCHCPERALRS